MAGKLPSFTRTRFAPTPSGYLHVGNAYSFLLTAALARQHGARILLRIDDMDRERVRPAYVQDVFDTLHFLELQWEEGPQDVAAFEAGWSQTHRVPLYQEALGRLAAAGRVYACTCSRADILKASPDGSYPGTCRHRSIPLDRPGAAWRLVTERQQPLSVKLLSGERASAALPALQTDFIVRKKDGYPAYQLSSLVDDVHFGVDLIVRGADLYDSTLAQLYLARVLGSRAFEEATFMHHGLLTDQSGRKLSKSEGASALNVLREGGSPLPDLLRQVFESAPQSERALLMGRISTAPGKDQI